MRPAIMTPCRGELIRTFSNALHGIHQKQKCVTVVTATSEGREAELGIKVPLVTLISSLYHLPEGQSAVLSDSVKNNPVFAIIMLMSWQFILISHKKKIFF